MQPSNAYKTPLSHTLNRFASRKALDEILKRGLAVPGHVTAVSGAIVTIAFDLTGLTLSKIAMPLAAAEYIRLPIQANDKGLAVPASFYLGGVSGLGGGTADTTLQGNLSTLFWLPIGSKNFSTVDPNAVTIYGPNGVVLRDTASGTVATLTPTGLVVTSTSGTISLSAGGHTVVISSAGVVIDGVTFAIHSHLPGTYVAGSTPVTGDSGIVI